MHHYGGEVVGEALSVDARGGGGASGGGVGRVPAAVGLDVQHLVKRHVHPDLLAVVTARPPGSTGKARR